MRELKVGDFITRKAWSDFYEVIGFENELTGLAVVIVAKPAGPVRHYRYPELAGLAPWIFRDEPKGKKSGYARWIESHK